MKKKLLMLLLAFMSVTACFAQSEKGLWGWKLENGIHYERFILLNKNHYYSFTYHEGLEEFESGLYSIDGYDMKFKPYNADSYWYYFTVGERDGVSFLYFENGGDGWDYNKIPDAQINDVQDESDFMNLILPYRKYGSDINEIQEDLNTFGNGYYLYELTDNLRIRESDSLESKVLLTLAEGSTVFVYKASRKDIIDGIESNWVNIWTVDAYDKNGNPVPRDTKGWCFGGYLKKLRPWLPQ